MSVVEKFPAQRVVDREGRVCRGGTRNPVDVQLDIFGGRCATGSNRRSHPRKDLMNRYSIGRTTQWYRGGELQQDQKLLNCDDSCAPESRLDFEIRIKYLNVGFFDRQLTPISACQWSVLSNDRYAQMLVSDNLSIHFDIIRRPPS